MTARTDGNLAPFIAHTLFAVNPLAHCGSSDLLSEIER
jgi:hypothetical protein